MRKDNILPLVIGLIVSFCLSFQSAAYGEETPLEVKVKSVSVDPVTSMPMVLLEDREGRKALPIFIGVSEANAIALVLERIPTRRPMTHDLMKSLLEAIPAKVKRVVLNDLKDNIFYAKIYLNVGGSEIKVDSRPSDAIALALRVDSPIFVLKAIMDEKGIDLPQEDTVSAVEKKFGVRLREITPQLARDFELGEDSGVLVYDVEPNGQASQDDIKPGDLILEVNREKVKDLQTLIRRFSEVKEGENILLRIVREEGYRYAILHSPSNQVR